MTADESLILKFVCLTLQCECKNKETIFDGGLSPEY